MGSPGRPLGASFLVLVLSKHELGTSLREEVFGATIAEWTRDVALILSGVAGLLHWGWWFPVLLGAVAALVREASQGFMLIQHCGSRYLIRSLTTTCLVCGVVEAVGYMLSLIQLR